MPVPNPYFVSIQLLDQNENPVSPNDIARVQAYDVFNGVVTWQGQSGYDPQTGGWQVVYLQQIHKFYPPREQPNLRFEVESTAEQVVHVTQVFAEIPSGGTVKIIIGVSDELLDGGQPPVTTWQVSGHVRRADGTPMIGAVVRAYDVTSGAEALLGTATLGPAGTYAITYETDDFDQNGAPHAQPNLQVRVFGQADQLLAESPLKVAASNNEVIDLAVGTVSAGRRVFGTVRNSIDLPVAGMDLSAYHVAWTSHGLQEFLLGQATSGGAGAYEIFYDPPQVSTPLSPCGPPHDQINLIVYAREEPQGGGEPETVSSVGVIFNAAVQQEANLVVDRIATAGVSEYERIDAAISDCLGEGETFWANLHQLIERPEFLAFVAQASGWSETLVRAYVRAQLIAGEINENVPAAALSTPMVAEAIYALLRAGLGESLLALVTVPPPLVFEAWIDGIHGGIVPAALEERLHATTEQPLTLLDDWRIVVARMLTYAPEGGGAVSWLKPLLDLVFGATVVEPFPSVEEVEPSAFGTETQSHSVPIPSETAEGDLLIVLFANRGSMGEATVTTPSGWTALWSTNNGVVRLGGYARRAQPGDASSNVNFQTSIVQQAAAQVYRVDADLWYGEVADAIVVGTPATNNTSTIQPPPLSHAWEEMNVLWIACAAHVSQIATTAWPANYEGTESVLSGAATNGNCTLLSARRELEGSGESPGTFQRASGSQWVAQTLVIRPGVGQVGQAAKQEAILAARFDHIGTFGELVDELEADEVLTSSEASDLRFVFEVYTAVDGFFPIVEALYADKGERGWSSIRDLTGVTRDNTASDPIPPADRGWVYYASTALAGDEFPAALPGGTLEERVRVYAQRLFDKFGELEPRDRLVGGLEQIAAGGSDEALQDAVGFLNENPEFDLGQGNLDTFLEAHSEITLSDDAQERVKQIQRCSRVTHEPSVIIYLIEGGLDSGVKIATIPEERFVSDHEEQVGGVQAAEEIHRAASAIATDVFLTLIQYNRNLSDVGGMLAIPGAVDVGAIDPTEAYDDLGADLESSRPSRRFPNWTTLFGDFNKCGIEHCQSVLGPGAYLVDVLQFIDEAPRRELFERRPDLEDIELTCANTNTLVPYIDLVNEVLEAAVVSREISSPGFTLQQIQDAVSGDVGDMVAARNAIREALHERGVVLTERSRFKAAPATVGGWVIEDDAWRISISASPLRVLPIPQTSATNDALEVFPEHTHLPAYDVLEEAVFPFNLPLVLGREETSVFLTQRGVGYHEILEAWSAADDVGELRDASRAYLDLAEAEETAIRTTERSAWEYWGFETAGADPNPIRIPRPDRPTVDIEGDWIQLLTRVPVFLHRTSLTYAQLLELLDTTFVHNVSDSGDPIVIAGQAEDLVECNYNNYQVANLDETRLRRISFVVRLWRKLGWTMREVDRYLTLLEDDTVPTSLQRLSLVRRLVDTYALEPRVVFSWWSGIDVRRTERLPKSLFDDVFVVGLPSQPEVQAFAAMGRAAQLGSPVAIDLNSPEADQDIPTYVRGALGLSVGDFDVLWERVVGSATALSLEMVGVLYRVATFTQAVGLSVVDYFDLTRLIGVDAVPETPPADLDVAIDTTHNALREIRRVQAVDAPPAEILYWLRHEGSEVDDFFVTPERFDAVAARLVQGVATVEAAVPEQANPDVSTLSAALGRLIPAERVVRVVQLIEGGLLDPAVPETLDEATEQANFLRRYLGPVWPDPGVLETYISRLQEDLPEGDLPSEVLARQEEIADRIQLAWDVVYEVLVTRAQRDEALAIASELTGLDVDATALLLEEGLQSIGSTEPALASWRTMLVGGWSADLRTLEDVSNGTWTTTLVIPRDGRFRFVAVAAESASVNVTLTVDGTLQGAAAPAVRAGRQEIEFDPLEAKRGRVLAVEFTSSTSDSVSLHWRIDDADPVVVPATVTVQFDHDTYVKLHKAARVVTGLRLSRRELRYLVQSSGALSLNGLPLDDVPANAVPWSALATFLDQLTLHRNIGMRGTSLFELWNEELTLQRIADATGWELADVQAVHDQGGAPPLDDPGFWQRLHDVMAIVRRVGLRVQRIDELLVDSEPSLPDAITLRNAFRSLFSSSTWKEAFKGPRDRVRQRQRDALVGYLTSRPYTVNGTEYYFFDANDLFAHFLIDVEMEPDTLVSRISLAHRVVQLFVQRATLGLEDESGFLEGEEAREQWNWMRNYRVWEANRKVFLYPENWIEPELRDDKTPFFQELEEELQEEEITSERGLRALTNYLARVADVSNLNVTGACMERLDESSDDIDPNAFRLHTIGRTRSQPRTYYYRTFETREVTSGEGVWTPWRKIDLEIAAPMAIPAMFNGRLILFWLTFTQAQSATTNEADLDGLSIFRTEIQIVWSEYDEDQDKWAKPRISKSKAIDYRDASPFTRDDGESKPSERPYHLFVRDLVFESAHTSPYLYVELYKWAKNTAFIPRDRGYLSRLGVFRLWATGDDEFEARPHHQEVNGSLHAVWDAELVSNAAELQAPTLSFYTNTSQDPTVFETIELPARVVGTNFPIFQNAATRQAPYFLETMDTSLFALGTEIERSPRRYDEPHTVYANFSTFCHPLIRVLQRRLRDRGAAGIFNRSTEALPQSIKQRSCSGDSDEQLLLGYYIAGDEDACIVAQQGFEADFSPRTGVERPYPMPTNIWNYGAPFGVYNWELFFHIPMLIAERLSQDMKFEDAMRWYHHVFDPRQGLTPYEQTREFVDALPHGSRYWTFLPFFANKDATQSLTASLGLQQGSTARSQCTQLARTDFATLVEQWRHHPFNPHLIARMRIVAYQKNVVMKYLDNLIDWADQLFRQDTGESIGEATQLYILAAEILGDRPEDIEPIARAPRYTYRELRAIGLDEFSNAVVELENLVGAFHRPSSATAPRRRTGRDQASRVALHSFFFHVPRNEKLTHYWDTVADRLFKIRNSMNIDGVRRQLALFSPPVDPGLLVRAAAAGLDLSGVVAQLNTPMPHYRFGTWVSRAIDLANEVRAFGGALLAALERKDAEELALLRQDHEIRVHELVRRVRERQIEEAEETIEALRASRAIAEVRYEDYRNREKVSERERAQIALTLQAIGLETMQGIHSSIGSVLAAIPEFSAGFLTAKAQFGGNNLNNIMQGVAAFIGTLAGQARGAAGIAGTYAGFERREEDWRLQERVALKEMEHIDQQIVAAEVRKAIAEHELENQEVILQQAQEVRTFYEDKFSSRDLYQWMVTELGKTHRQFYRLAFDVAKMAERTFQFELGTEDTFIGTDYVDSLRKGLLAGERLLHDVKRMELAYLGKNKREYELQKRISLAQINPMALQDLRERGSCTFDVPEVVFDLDHPGHYFRRIRGVQVTIPCVTGPYAAVTAKLSLVSNAIRTASTATPSEYAYGGYEDPRFVHDLVGIQSIATSTAQDDAGLFELNFRDERYLPFEGAGAISRWRLELPQEAPQFDYLTISDVVLQMSYTARDGGGLLTQGANLSIADGLNAILQLASQETGLQRILSLRQEYPEAYRRLLSGDSVQTEIALAPTIFPYVIRRYNVTLMDDIVQVRVKLRPGASPTSPSMSINGATPSGGFSAQGEVLFGDVSDATPPLEISAEQTQTWTLQQTDLTEERVEDIYLAFKYQIS